MITERELLYVKTIAEEKSISKAAKKLVVTQPALSVCVQKIESSLDVMLFKRTHKGLLLTFAGERYYRLANDILKIYNDFETEMEDINTLRKGRITLGITVYLATYILPIILPVFKQRCPNVEVVLVEKNSTEVEEALASGEIDFAILHSLSCDECEGKRNINVYPLFRDPYLLVTKKDHRLCRYAVHKKGQDYPYIDLTLFAREPFIMVNQEQRIRQVTERILQKASINPFIAITTKSYETARRLAGEGIGVTLIPRQYLNIFSENYYPAYYYIDEKYLPYWTMCVMVLKDAHLSQAAQLFIKMVSERFG